MEPALVNVGGYLCPTPALRTRAVYTHQMTHPISTHCQLFAGAARPAPLTSRVLLLTAMPLRMTKFRVSNHSRILSFRTHLPHPSLCSSSFTYPFLAEFLVFTLL